MKTTYAFIIILSLVAFSACQKNWLDAKPSKSLVVPTTIADYQALLDKATDRAGTTVSFNINQGAMGEVSAGDFYMTDASWQSISATYERNLYIWAPQIYGGEATIGDWDIPYQRIFNSNVVLEGISMIQPKTGSDQIAWNQVKGSALFFRAYNHFDIAQSFCLPYDQASAETDLGIPLRLNADFNAKSIRSTVQQAYDQIIQDLRDADSLLPVTMPDNTSYNYQIRPTKIAVEAMLARVYLSMANYDSAFKYSDKCLQQYSGLLDYNTIDTTYMYPVPAFNTEVIWYMTLANYPSFSVENAIVDSILYNSYLVGDLRKSVFFTNQTGKLIFQGSYDQSPAYFSGLATDEMYLTRAECNARNGNLTDALMDINTLLTTRWQTGLFVPLTAINATDALSQILAERRKELCFRGTRWTDLRRLNKDPVQAVVLTREVLGQTYSLPPNDPRYVLPIPIDVIKLSGMQQNNR